MISLEHQSCYYCLSFDELLELSQQGNNRVIDMLVGDIYGGIDYKKVYNILDIPLSAQDDETMLVLIFMYVTLKGSLI